MKEKLKAYVLNSLWIYKNILPFFVGILGLIVVISTLLNCLFLLNSRKVNGKVLFTETRIVTSHDGSQLKEEILSVGYTVDGTDNTTTLTTQLDNYRVGDAIPLRVAGKWVRINSWFDLFGLPFLSSICLVISIICFRLLSKLKYNPKGYDGALLKMGKRYD